MSMDWKALGSLVLVLLIGLGWVSPVTAAPGSQSPSSETITTPASTVEAVSQPSIQGFLQELENLKQKAFQATNEGDFKAAEDYWTQLIERLPQSPVVWSNRGNTKLSQNKLQSAIADYDKAIELAPEVPDAYLNRGIAYEALGRWDDAIADYDQALKLNPNDAAAYNNRGNAAAGKGDWQAALLDFKQAAEMGRKFSFARNNYALALYQLGQTGEAIRTLRQLVRKYPNFADARAALTAALWAEDKQGEAESQWVSVIGLDARYKDLAWLQNTRRWPPALVTAMEKFLKLKA
ncbi:MAG: tetratricopeptide repeat protein [Leptolyngbyaceae cyanobacterium]